MSNGTYSQFFSALGQNESGNNYSFESSLGYLGRFQFGEEALKVIGFYAGDSTSAIDFIGSWTPTAAAYGVTSEASFLASPAAQDAAATAWFLKIDNDLKSLGLTSYVGQTVGGVGITTSGLIAGAHLVGVWALKSYLESGGAIDTVDGYGTHVSTYVAKFGAYDTPFDPGQIAPGVTAAADTVGVTSVATLTYEFFTGHSPTAAGMDYLTSSSGGNPNSLTSAYYQSFGLENRYINFAVNLGKIGEGAANFAAHVGGETLFDATRTAYTEIFGSAPTDAKLHALLDPTTNLNGVEMTRADYFAYYGGDGADGIGTKAAMVGWLLAEAEKAHAGTYAMSNDAYLSDVTLHGASYGVDIIGAYSKPGFILG